MTNGPAGSATPPTRSRAHTLDERVSAALSRLSPAQQRVVTYLQTHPEDAAFQSAAGIGESIDVSDATVIRTTQALGYSGLAELKDELRETLRRRVAPAARYARSIRFLSDHLAGILDHLLADQVEIISEARRNLRPADFERAVGLLAAADRVVVFGAGPQAVLAEYVVQMLRRFGRHGLVLQSSGVPLVDSMTELAAGDVLLTIAYERPPRELDVMLGLAKRRKVPVVLVTDTLALALKGRYAVALVARRGSPDSATTITVPLVILEALLLGVAAADRDRTLAALEEVRDLRERIGVG